jgi:hypothetical protein
MSQRLILPNLVIAGAPKCGSTSLYHYLSAHPEVCASSQQESRYLIDKGYPLFNKDFSYLSHGLEGYTQFFHHCTTLRHHIILDCTPDYLYQQTALHVLSEQLPKPTVVFILRDPVKRAYSMFQYARNNLANLDPKLSFRMFVSQVKTSKQAHFSNRLILGNVIEHGKYINYLTKWLEHFGAESILVVLFENMKSDPRHFMKQLACKIGIDDKFYDDFSFNVKNQTIAIRNQTLHHFKRKWGPQIKIPIVRDIGAYLYNRINTKLFSNSLQQEDTLTMQSLYSEFEGVNRELATLFALDISAWRHLK